MKQLPDEVFAAVLSTLRSYQYGNASPDLAEEVADKMVDEVMVVPEGCTATDARVLRDANHKMAERLHTFGQWGAMIQAAAAPLLMFNSSEAYMLVKVKTSDITRMRDLLKELP